MPLNMNEFSGVAAWEPFRTLTSELHFCVQWVTKGTPTLDSGSLPTTLVTGIYMFARRVRGHPQKALRFGFLTRMVASPLVSLANHIKVHRQIG